MRLRRLVLPILLVLTLAASVGCGPDEHKGELVYSVTKLDGSAPAENDLQKLSTELNIRLEEAGYPRNEVGPLPGGRVRVVLPESVVDRLPAIRKIVENPEGLGVKLTPTTR